MTCRVSNCRSRESHTSRHHLCIICNALGKRCNEHSYLSEEVLAENMPGNIHCTIPLCRDPNSHVTKNHICAYCEIFFHSEAKCYWRWLFQYVKCPVCRETNVIFGSNNNEEGAVTEEESCVVCMEKATVLSPLVTFPKCKHRNTCTSCVKKMDSLRGENEAVDGNAEEHDVNEGIEFFALSLRWIYQIDHIKNQALTIFGTRVGPIYGILRDRENKILWYVKRSDISSQIEILPIFELYDPVQNILEITEFILRYLPFRVNPIVDLH